MRRFESWSLGRKLGFGLGLTVAVFLVALGVTLLFAASAESKFTQTKRWDTAVKGIGMQIRSTQIQMTEQSLLVATWDASHMQAWENGVKLGDRGAQMVATVHDPVINRISTEAMTADHHHDDTVHHKLFPAFQAGDHAAALTALLKADAYVRVPYAALLKIQARIDQLRANDVASAQHAAGRARLFGIIAALLGTLMATGLALLIVRGVRRPIAALVSVSEAAASGDLTVRAATGSDELGRLGQAFNSMVGNLSELVGRHRQQLGAGGGRGHGRQLT